MLGLVGVFAGCPSVSQQPERATSEGGTNESSTQREPTEERSASTSRSPERVFPAQVAAPSGRGFYTDDASELRTQLSGFLADVEPNTELESRDLLGFLSPHAGYRYSGPTAASAYAQLKGRNYKTLVVLAFSHRQRSKKIALLDHDAYSTPLGPVSIDTELVQQLIAADPELLEVNEGVFRGEHSLEIQLPFIQLTLGDDVSIVPILVVTGDAGHSQRLARVLHETLGTRRDVLYVASSDLTHFYPYEEASRRDRDILSLVTGLQLDQYRERGPLGREMPCGYFPLLTLMELATLYEGSARRSTLLQYQNSGDTAGDRSRVVGYGAVAFSLDQGVRTAEQPPPTSTTEAESTSAETASSIPYSREDRQSLLDIARASVAAAVRSERHSPARPSSSLLTEPGAAFVTLNCQTDGAGRCTGRGEGLRGCIGHVVARVPLFECVNSVARSAAIEDRRFRPLTRAELELVTYEISVLTPPEAVQDPETVVVGRDGLIMTRGRSHGLLLPQVPIEWGWNRQQFLERTCRKANMEQTCWRDPRTRIERFSAIVWGEDLVASDHHE